MKFLWKFPELNAIHPGPIISQNDGERHFISYHMLIQLYKLNPCKCILWRKGSSRSWDDYNHYYPDPKGEYKK